MTVRQLRLEVRRLLSPLHFPAPDLGSRQPSNREAIPTIRKGLVIQVAVHGHAGSDTTYTKSLAGFMLNHA
jgi:hypothetical protein